MLTSSEVTAVLDHQTAVMAELASGASLGSILEAIVEALEELMPGTQCSILLLDADGVLRHGAAPSLPDAYSAEIDGLRPGPLAGSCGTAVYTGEPVIAVDVRVDERWEPFRELATEHGLRACWSSPIRFRSEVVGTFAVYHRDPHKPGERDRELVRRFTHLASLAVEHDRVSQLREARHEAELAKQSAERANQAKSQFVTALSHELRTPLQAITSFAENLQALDLSPTQRQVALSQIDDAAAHILSIVDDVLDLARVEAGAMPITLAAVDVAEVIEATIGIVAPLAAQRDSHLEVSEQDGAGPALSVRADRRRLTQVLLNLCANSVRFSPPGSVICIETCAMADAVGIAVIDHGPGIPAELLERLFVPFDRLGADAGREGGAGLGLILARRLTEAMSGTLDLLSEVGVGTHVTVTLPREKAKP